MPAGLLLVTGVSTGVVSLGAGLGVAVAATATGARGVAAGFLYPLGSMELEG